MSQRICHTIRCTMDMSHCICNCMIVRPLYVPHKRLVSPTNNNKQPALADVVQELKEPKAQASPKSPKRRGRVPTGNGISRHLHCEHQRRKTTCVECQGGSICEHGKQRPLCVDCYDAGTGGRSLCSHKVPKKKCKVCPLRKRRSSKSTTKSPRTK